MVKDTATATKEAKAGFAAANQAGKDAQAGKAPDAGAAKPQEPQPQAQPQTGQTAADAAKTGTVDDGKDNAKTGAETFTNAGTTGDNAGAGATPPAAKVAPHGDVALRLANHMINHFADRSDIGRMTTEQFHAAAVDTGLMKKAEYDPKAHAYLKPWAESRNINPGEEVLVFTEEGEALIAEAGKQA